MSTSTVACYNFAANKPRSSARKSSSHSFFGGAAVASLVLGCAVTVYANIFAASPFPQLGSAYFDAPVIRRPQAVAVNSAPQGDSITRIAEIKPPPVLTKRGADILVRVEKLLDDAARTAGEPAKPTKPVSSTSAGFTDSFASASPESPVASPAPRKN